MDVEEFSGLKFLKTKTFFDSRGYFRETFKSSSFNESCGCRYDFVQDNEAFSGPAYVLRGLHYQKKPKAQAKLVRVVSGSIYDVVVDLRSNSSSYGKWKGFELNSEEGSALFVPEGFAHGYMTLVENTIVTYKVSDYYAPETEAGVIWNDPDIGVKWPETKDGPIVSEKDLLLPRLRDLSGKLSF